MYCEGTNQVHGKTQDLAVPGVCMEHGFFGCCFLLSLCVFPEVVLGYLITAWSGPPRLRGRKLKVCFVFRFLKANSLAHPCIIRRASLVAQW